MHEIDDAGQHVGVGLGDDAVAEVEDVPGGGAAGLERRAGARGHRLPWREEQGRVEVALQRQVGTDPARGLVQRHPEVDADDIGTCPPHQRQQLARAHSEVDARHAGVRQGGEHG